MSRFGKSGHDDTLLSSMATRLRKVEEELQQKNTQLEVNEKELHKYRVHLAECQNKDKPVSFLKSECLKAHKQIQEMEDFLADYGMIWVGEEETDVVIQDDGKDADDDDIVASSITKSTWTQNDSVADYTPNFTRVLANIHELNIMGGDGVGVVEKGADGIARVVQPDPIPLTLYANGLLLFSGPFRSYSEPYTTQMVKDFEDGYFPSELQARYPKGMPIKVTDLREKVFVDRRLKAVFPGKGNTLTGAAKELADIRGLSFAEHDSNSETVVASNGESIQRFLSKLPNSTVRDGKIIDIRASIGTMIGVPSHPDTNNKIEIAETAVVKEIQAGSAARSAGPVSTLRVKLAGGSKTLIVKLRYSDTIQDIRIFVDQHHKEGGLYEIRTTFPNKVYGVTSQTLEDAGLVPSATLHIRDI